MITISPIKKRVRKTSFGELLDYEATAGIQISGDLEDTFLTSENDWKIGRGTIMYLAFSSGDLIKLEIIRKITYIILDGKSNHELNGELLTIFSDIKWILCSNYDHDMELGRTGQNDPLIINRFEKNNENLEDF